MPRKAKLITDTSTFQASPGLKRLMLKIRDRVPLANDPDEGIREVINDISRRERSALTRSAALEAYRRNRVVLLLDKNRYGDIPSYLPLFSIRGGDGQNRVYACAFRQTSKTSAGGRYVHPRALLGYLSAGAMYWRYLSDPGKFSRNNVISTESAIVYSRAVHAVLDKRFGIGQIAAHSDQIRYCLAKFCLLNMLSKDWTPLIDDYASKAARNSDQATLKLADSEAGLEAYDSFETLIAFFAHTFPRMSRAIMRDVLAEMATMYRASGMMMADYYPYLMAHIVFYSTDSGLGNDFAFEKAMGGRVGATLFKSMANLS